MYTRGKPKKNHNNKPAKRDVSDSDKYADLLVFGYASKVYRDNEKALFHDHGKHLIPWMGDKKITIDRYDGRGHLHDLSEYDCGSWNTAYQLSEEEARIEALCDEERYLAMRTDLLEEEARQEEEYKRLSEALADEEEAEQDEDEEPFVAPAGLTIPPDVELPATCKTHAIIERTANFVSQQGAQFEIVLKAKQSGNSQFDFLAFDHYLNPYYKHILLAMKEGRYASAVDKKPDAAEDSSDNSDDDGDGSYLHPSLFAPKKNARLPLQVMDPDHPLAELVRRAKLESNGGYAAAAVVAVVATSTPSALRVPEVRPPPASVAPSVIIPPPPDIQPVIDKLAEYVARNGVKFETSVRAKNDPRFDFLQTWNQYNTYYEFKKNYFMQKEGISLPESDSASVAEDDKDEKEATVAKAAFAPICFAIRAKENDMLPLEKNRVRLDDDSDEDKLLEEKGADPLANWAEAALREAIPAALEEKRPVLTAEELEAKQAKQKLEDRLAAAAREKLAQASKESKEKQLQAERKRKAALFLQTLRGPVSGEPEAKRAELDPVTPHQVKPAVQEGLNLLPPVEHSVVHRSREGPASSAISSHSHSRGAERERNKGSPPEKRKASLRSSGAVTQTASSALSPSFSPAAARSPSASPASSLGQSRRKKAPPWLRPSSPLFSPKSLRYVQHSLFSLPSVSDVSSARRWTGRWLYAC
ncbi:hypothetical protein NHX12_027277 [Muraenolepis orangiensis]|uniref:Splicing factor, suppressor of white-apricot homolog n=1 Tax=Muraenolepis orangiensis TaxID=630683 RepID=A0A9Q0EC18_9TELE|nr:hypothetical protein NHX12_027277 [Muraenolepis orangiensis]